MKKVLAILLAMGMTAALLTACGGSGSGTEETKIGAADFNKAIQELKDDGTFDQIVDYYIGGEGDRYVSPEDVDRSNGKLVMATNAEFPPYEYREGDEIVGIDADFAQAICDKLGCELEIEDMAFDAIIPAVQSGKADFGAAGMTVTDERKTQVDFTDSYYTGKQVIIVAQDSKIKSADDLADAKIGVQTGTTGDIYVTDDYGDDHVERFNKGFEAVQSLTQGKIDAVVIDDQPAQAFVAEAEGLTILEAPYVEEDYAMCFKKAE